MSDLNVGVNQDLASRESHTIVVGHLGILRTHDGVADAIEVLSHVALEGEADAGGTPVHQDDLHTGEVLAGPGQEVRQLPGRLSGPDYVSEGVLDDTIKVI